MNGWHEDFEDEQDSYLWDSEQYAWDNRDESDPNDPYYDPYWDQEYDEEPQFGNEFQDERDWL